MIDAGSCFLMVTRNTGCFWDKTGSDKKRQRDYSCDEFAKKQKYQRAELTLNQVMILFIRLNLTFHERETNHTMVKIIWSFPFTSTRIISDFVK